MNATHLIIDSDNNLIGSIYQQTLFPSDKVWVYQLNDNVYHHTTQDRAIQSAMYRLKNGESLIAA